MTDLIDAAKDILFACPLLNKSRKKTILPVLKKEITLGASVTVCTRAPESYRLEQRDALKELITRLKENGITAKTQVELLYH